MARTSLQEEHNIECIKIGEEDNNNDQEMIELEHNEEAHDKACDLMEKRHTGQE